LPASAQLENQWFSFSDIAIQESRFSLVTFGAFCFKKELTTYAIGEDAL
jgi:hypothetical protein